MPRAAFLWMALGAVQYLATARTALAISGRVDIDSHIKLRTNSRNGQFSTLSSSSNSSSSAPTRSGTLCVEVTQNVFTIITHRQTFSGISSEYPSSVRVCCGNLHTIRFNSSRNTSNLLYNSTANMSSTSTTAMIAARPSSTKRKMHASAKHC